MWPHILLVMPMASFDWLQWALTGKRLDMYPSPEHRANEIEAGAGRSGLDLQIDMDTSAGRLSSAFDELDGAEAWDAVVEMSRGVKVPARLLPLARLLEVVIHHVDLDIGYEITDIDTQTAEWLLEWCAFRLRDREDFPKLELTSDSGFTTTVGSVGRAGSGQWQQRRASWLAAEPYRCLRYHAGQADSSSRHSDGGHQPRRTGRAASGSTTVRLGHDDQGQCRTGRQQCLSAADQQWCQPAHRRGQRR